MVVAHDAVARLLIPNAPVRTLIVDDERLSRDRIRALLEQRSDVEVVGECADGLAALHAIDANPPDLVFLDVEMPELTGLAVLEAIEAERCPQVVFVTAHDQYLQRAFEVHALDYLRKPFTDQRFYDALEHACRRVQERLERALTHESVRTLLAELRQQSNQIRDRIIVQDKERGAFHVVRAHDIDWIEANDGGVRIHVGKQEYATRNTLSEVEARLDPAAFLRVHRAHIVNRSRITKLEPVGKGEFFVTLAGGQRVGTGRTYREAVEAFLETA
jgi:two-component system, LytTR family, response regulator